MKIRNLADMFDKTVQNISLHLYPIVFFSDGVRGRPLDQVGRARCGDAHVPFLSPRANPLRALSKTLQAQSIGSGMKI